jgi:hypothetical protein
MSKYGSPDFALYVGGYDLTPAVNESASRKHENLTQATRPLGMAYERNTPTGIVKDTLTVGNGMFDKVVDPLNAAAVSEGGIDATRVICFCEQGQTKGAHFTGYSGALVISSEVLDSNGALTKANVAYAMSGPSEEGVILQELASKTANWTTETSDAVDAADEPGNRHIAITSASLANPSVITTTDNHNLASGEVVAIFDMAGLIAPDINDNPAAAEAWKLIGHTVTVTGDKTFTIPVNVTHAGTGGYCVVVSRATGGYGYHQVTQGSGFTAFVGKVRHSVNNSTWNDLVTFTDTATSYHAVERKATATTTTQVARYLAYKGTVTGSVGATPFKVFGGFCRGA